VNFGDLLNKWFIEKLFDVEVEWCSPECQRRKQHLLAIGSILDFANSNSVVWGTGLLETGALPKERPTYIAGLRGALSAHALKNAGLLIPDALGDPGLVVSRLYGKQVQKTYEVGVVPHYVDQKHPAVQDAARHSDTLVINVMRSPELVCSQILSCAAIASSSLHGIMAADSFQVPNVWIKLTDQIEGGGFKFRDHFTVAQRLRHEPTELGTTFDRGIMLRCEIGEFHPEILELIIKSFPLDLF